MTKEKKEQALVLLERAELCVRPPTSLCSRAHEFIVEALSLLQEEAEQAGQAAEEPKRCDVCGEIWKPRHFWHCKGDQPKQAGQADVYICDECNREGVMCSLRIVNSLPTYCPVSGEELDSGEWCKKQQAAEFQNEQTCENCARVVNNHSPLCKCCVERSQWTEAAWHIAWRLRTIIDAQAAQLTQKETALTDCRIIKDRAEHLREEAEQQLAAAQADVKLWRDRLRYMVVAPKQCGRCEVNQQKITHWLAAQEGGG